MGSQDEWRRELFGAKGLLETQRYIHSYNFEGLLWLLWITRKRCTKGCVYMNHGAVAVTGYNIVRIGKWGMFCQSIWQLRHRGIGILLRVWLGILVPNYGSVYSPKPNKILTWQSPWSRKCSSILIPSFVSVKCWRPFHALRFCRQNERSVTAQIIASRVGFHARWRLCIFKRCVNQVKAICFEGHI